MSFKTTYNRAVRAFSAIYKDAQTNYHFMFSNCVQAVAIGLRAAGIYSGNSMIPNDRFKEIRDYYKK